jgi:hypothetical protein
MKPHLSAPKLALALFPVVLFLPISVIASDQSPPEGWRRERWLIDLHQHIDCTTQHLARTIKIMDAAGLGIAVNLSGGTVTRAENGGSSEFERNKRLADALFPRRLLHYMYLDYAGWDDAGFAERAVNRSRRGIDSAQRD